MTADATWWLPVIFAGLLGVAILLYAMLDGFDLGVGLLFPFADPQERDRMIGAIGPFWDGNETWLVLAVGLLLVAFPAANGAILTALYPLVVTMLIGLILRGVAFEFRAKAPTGNKPLWDRAFFLGSLLASAAQGAMLGLYVLGLNLTPAGLAFAGLTAICLPVAFSFSGAAWLILKTEGLLQLKAVHWARHALWGVAVGLAGVSLATPLASPRLFHKWLDLPAALLLAPLPILALVLLVWLKRLLDRLPLPEDRLAWAPFAGALALLALGFGGMAYSFWPYVLPETLTIWQAASAPDSLRIMLWGALAVVPVILGYTALAYRIFRGKATALDYD